MEERVIRTHECFSRGPQQGLCPASAIYRPKSHRDSARKPRANLAGANQQTRTNEVKSHRKLTPRSITHLCFTVLARLNSRSEPLTIHQHPGPRSFFFLLIHIVALLGSSTSRVTTPPGQTLIVLGATEVQHRWLDSYQVGEQQHFYKGTRGSKLQESERVRGGNRPGHKDFMKCSRWRPRGCGAGDVMPGLTNK